MVIDRLKRGIDGYKVTCLLGNHEVLMLECLQSDDSPVWHTWPSNGGETILSNLGISMRFGGYDSENLSGALKTARID